MHAESKTTYIPDKIQHGKFQTRQTLSAEKAEMEQSYLHWRENIKQNERMERNYFYHISYFSPPKKMFISKALPFSQ